MELVTRHGDTHPELRHTALECRIVSPRPALQITRPFLKETNTQNGGNIEAAICPSCKSSKQMTEWI